MTLTLDAASEEVVLRELRRGHYSDPAEVVAQALSHFVRETQVDAAGQVTARRPVDAVFGLWADRGVDGVEYQRRLRDEWDR